ncbi:hypothetical protein F4802DRAFT_382765 [Xylaria palmicola]|nr:hypothetical protein F4802DRAFT_382765 [Xylaria palmicola]
MALPFVPPASLDSSFTISVPTEADLDAMAQVYYDSFAMDPGNTYWWSPDRDAMFEWLRWRIRRKMSDRRVRHFQVRDGAGELVAWARWDIPEGFEARFGDWAGIDGQAAAAVPRDAAAEDDDDTATTAPLEEQVPADAKAMETPRGADPELCRHFFAMLATLSKKWEAEGMLGLSLLCTAPKYHRRGAGKALLTPMLAIADAAGLRSYVEATPAGQVLYERLGYRAVEVKELDATAFTGGRVKGVTKLSIMIREPQPTQESP